MRIIPVILFFFLAALHAAPSFSADKEIPFREDSGLTKTEYLLSAGQFSAALDEAGGVLSRHPGNADAYTYRGYAYYRLGEKPKAEENFKRALQLNPTHLGANKYLADIYLDAGDVARAIEQLQVLRMTCGHTDCEELRALERDIDQHKQGASAENKPKKDE